MAPRRFPRFLIAAVALAIASGAAAGAARVILVGDSTMAPRNGYGDALCELLRPNVECLNLARNGRSTRTFRSDGSWDRVTAALGDREANRSTWVLVQLGHNDQPGKAERSTDLATEFPANISRYVDEIEAAGAHAVLVTPLTRRPFRDGVHVNDLAPWAEAIRRIARERKLPLLDLNAESAAAVARMGSTTADALAMQPPEFDHTHLGTEGAHYFARMVHRELAQALPSLTALTVARPQLREGQLSAYSYAKVIKAADGWDPLSDALASITPLKPDYIVDAAAPADGKTRFRTLQRAVDAAVAEGAGQKPRARIVILVKPGTYRELLYVPQSPVAVSIIGENAATTRVIANLESRTTGERYARDFGAQFADSPPAVVAMFTQLKQRATVSTPGSAVAWIRNHGFQAKDITFENGYNRDGGEELRGPDGRPVFSQAVALMVDGADKVQFDSVRFIGYQDTIYLKTDGAPGNRVFIDRSYIEGDMDFIFGDATAWFQRTEIRSLGRRPVHYVIAPSTHYDTPVGFVFNDCRFTHDGTPNALAGTFKLARQWFRGQRCTPYGNVPAPPGYACTLGAEDTYEAPIGTVSKATLATVGKVVIMNSRIGAHIDRSRPWANWNAPGTPRYRPVQYDSQDYWDNLVAAGIDPASRLGQAARKSPVEPFLAEYRNTDE